MYETLKFIHELEQPLSSHVAGGGFPSFHTLACEVSDATASNPEESRLPMPSHMEEKDKVLALSARWTQWHPNPGKSHSSVFFPAVYYIPIFYNVVLHPCDATQYNWSQQKHHAYRYTATNFSIIKPFMYRFWFFSFHFLNTRGVL